MSAEFDWISRMRARLGEQPGVALGIGDDGAVLCPQAGEDWVLSTDTMVAGVHFPLDAAPADVGHKLVAVNLSDLAAMGAQPRYASMNLTLPGLDLGYLDPLLDGLLQLAAAHGLHVIGGDTCSGPMVLSLTVIGSLPQGSALRRSTARAGDAVYVSGTLGDAAAALALRGRVTGNDPELRLARARLDQRLARPTPRCGLGLALRGIASACIDVSDGLAADLGHIAEQSELAAVVDGAALPCSRALLALVPDAGQRLLHQLGGDDYELCFCIDPAREAELDAVAAAAHVALTRIGTLGSGSGVHFLQADGSLGAPPRRGYQHFA